MCMRASLRQLLSAAAAGVLQDVDPRELQISLTGFLEKNTSLFCKVNRGCHLTTPCWLAPDPEV